MTMKTKKTLQHIAAVAVVLLTLCLVFAAPVAAESTTDCDDEDTCTHAAVIGTTHYDTLKEAISAAGSDATIYLYGTISESSIKLPATITNLTIDGQGTAIVKDTVISASDGNSINYQGLAIKNTTFENSRFVLGGQRNGDVIYKNLVFEGNTFRNITDASSMAAIHMNIASEDNEYIENFRFVGNTIVNVTGSSNSGVLMKNAKGNVIFEDNTISNVVNNAIQCINAKGDINLVIKNNRLSSNLGSVLNLYNVPVVTLENNTITLNEGQKELGNFNTVATIGNIYYSNLQDVIDVAEAGTIITLLNDVTLTDDAIHIYEGMDITIEGKGKNITSANGKDVFYVHGGKLVLGEGLDVYSPTDCAVYIRGGDVVTSANLKASGGYSPILGHQDYSGNVTINGGSVVGPVAGSVAIYWPQNGSLIVNGGTITGDTGIEIRAGTLTVNGGTISGTGLFETRVTEDGNTVMGAGIAVSQFTTNYDTVVIINDGTITGEYALYEQNLTTTEKDAEALEKISLSINGGTLTGNIFSENEVNFIKGGSFSVNPSAYIASGYEVVQPGNSYLVQKYVDRSSSSSSSSTTEPEQPEQPVVEPETPAAPGEATVETEVTNGGEVELETPAAGGSAAADEDETKITGVVLPTGTEGKVEFIPVSEQPAPAGQEENTKKVFEINVPSYEKGKAAVIKFTMTVAELAADGKEAADVALWHFDEETGEWTKLVTSYTIVDGVVYFEAITEDFSPFAIIYEDEPAGDMPGNEPQDEPETPESPAPLLGVLAALGAAVVLRRK